MPIRCIALDLDGTTLNAHGKLSDENRSALQLAIASGVHVVIASGRPLSSLPQDLLDLPGIEYAITSNGAAVYHLPTGNRLAHYTLDTHSVETILQLTARTPYPLETFIDGKAFAAADFISDPTSFGAPASSIPYLQRTRTPVRDMPSFIREHINCLDSLDLILDGAAANARLRLQLQSVLPDCYITSSVPHLLEISHKNCGKHSGVRVIAETLGLSPAEIAAFGDADNDVDMLRYVGCGIAVANASSACLAAANRVTSSHNENGVAKGIYELLQE